MTPDVELRPARVGDAAAIVAIIRDSFPPELRERIVYGCPGMQRFVEDLIRVPRPLAERRYTVAAAGQRIIGCVEVAPAGSVLMLNYIAAAQDARGAGLGRRLLQAALSDAGAPAFGSMVLDVLADNHVAREWYLRLGFAPVAASTWWALTLDGRGLADDAGAIISGWAQAEAAHARFGFSELRVTTGTAAYAIGRLGSRWYRTAEPAALADTALHGALQRLDAGREVLAVLPDEVEPPAAMDPVPGVRTVRMQLGMLALLERLGLQP